MNRSIKISLASISATKLYKVQALKREILSAVNYFIDSLWITPGALDANTLNRLKSGSLSYRHRQNALKLALEILSITKKSAYALGVKSSKPNLTGSISLSSLVVKIEKGEKSFDYALKISGLSKGHPIIIPFKSHKHLNYWLDKGATIKQGCILGDTWAGLWLELPTPEIKQGPTLGVDIGFNKLLVDSNGVQYGTGIKKIVQSIKRKKPGSKARQRAHAQRKDYINRVLKGLPWASIGTLGIECLKNLKKGKKKNRSKNFRKAIAPWTYRQVMTRVPQLAQENRVRLVAVNPRDTSRTCPSCGSVARENRRGEVFKCVSCNYSNDADYVGAMNILARTLGNSQECMVPESHYALK